MSKNHARAAGIIAAALPENLSETLSALLDSAELHEAFVPLAPLPAGHARNLKRKSAFHACTAASAAATREDQMVFAKEQRITALRALCENPRLDVSVAFVLLEKAIARQDDAMMQSLAKCLPVAHVVKSLASNQAMGLFPSFAFAEALSEDHDRQDMLDALSVESKRLAEFFGLVAAKASAGFFKNFTLQDVMDALSKDMLGDVVTKAIFHSSTITSELAIYAVNHANVAAALAEFRYKAPSPLGVGALDVFLKDPDLGQYRQRLAHHTTPPEDLLALFNATVKCLPLNSTRSFADMPVWHFVKTHHEYMGENEARAVADFLITQDVKESSILDACSRHILRLLDISRRTQLLQRCGAGFVAYWMSGQEENQAKPEPGEATAVLSSLDNRELRDVAASVASLSPDMALHPLWPEFRVALGAGLLEVSLENRWTNWIKDDTVRFLADHIGDNPAAWSLIVSLWPSFDGSVSELLEIATSLS